MGINDITPIENWEKNPMIKRLIDAHMFKDATVIRVGLKVVKNYKNKRARRYACVTYEMDNKTRTAELKLRDDRHWERRQMDGTKNERETYLTASDIQGQEGVSSTKEIDGRI